MKLILASALSVIAMVFILLALRRRDTANDIVEVSLEEFAKSHWLKAENTPETKEEPKEEQSEINEEKDGLKDWLAGQSDASIVELVRELIVPIKDTLLSQNALSPILSILDTLGKFGDCPSVAKRLNESDGINSYWDVFYRISLKDHTLRVTRKMMEIYVANYDRPYQAGAYLLTALGHDLGKIPQLRESKKYSLGDHPAISADFVSKSAEGVSYIAEVITAIKNHHKKNQKDPLTVHLQDADGKAREEELRLFKGESESEPHNADWIALRLPEIMTRIRPSINEVLGYSKWRAFSMPDGMTYLDSDLLWECAKKLAEEINITDMDFIAETRKDRGKIRIADELRKRGWLAEGIKPGFYGSYWKFWMGEKERKGYWTAVHTAEAFGVLPSELEGGKKYPLKLIKRVELSKEGRSGGGNETD